MIDISPGSDSYRGLADCTPGPSIYPVYLGRGRGLGREVPFRRICCGRVGGVWRRVQPLLMFAHGGVAYRLGLYVGMSTIEGSQKVQACRAASDDLQEPRKAVPHASFFAIGVLENFCVSLTSALRTRRGLLLQNSNFLDHGSSKYGTSPNTQSTVDLETP